MVLETLYNVTYVTTLYMKFNYNKFVIAIEIS